MQLDRLENSIDQSAARVAVSWYPLDWLDSRFFVDVSSLATQSYGDQLTNATDEALEFLRAYDPTIEDDPFNHSNSQDLPGIYERTTRTASTVNAMSFGALGPVNDLNLSSVSSVSSYDQPASYDLENTPADIIRLDFDIRYRQLTQELRLNGVFENLLGRNWALDVIVGGYYSQADLDADIRIDAGEHLLAYAASEPGTEAIFGESAPGGVSQSEVLNQLGLNPTDVLGAPLAGNDGSSFIMRQQSSGGALFFDASLDFGDRVTAALGYRVGEETKRVSMQAVSRGAGLTSAAIGIEDYDERLSRTESERSPKASLTFRWTDDVSLFANVAKGFKGGGYNFTAFTDRELQFEPERATTSEVGLKSSLFSDTLSLNVTAFRSEFENLQVQTFNGSTFVVENAASSRSQGVEIDANWLSPWPALSILASAGYLDATYLAYPNAPAPGEPEAVQDLTGQPLANAPTWTASLTPQVDVPLTWLPDQVLAASFAIDLLYQGDQFLDTDLDPVSFQSGYTVVNARLGVSSEATGWQFQLAGRNLTDADALTLVFDHPVLPRSYSSRQLAPRQLYAQLQFSY